MKVALLVPCPLVRDLGGPRDRLETAEALTMNGCDVEIIPIYQAANPSQLLSPQKIIEVIRVAAKNFDVVEITYQHLPILPFDRDLGSILITRSVLLPLHLANIRIPRPEDLLSAFKRIIRIITGKEKTIDLDQEFKQIASGDFISVPNSDDVRLLIDRGISPKRIILHPCGMHDDRLDQLTTVANASRAKNRVIFLGSFDYRKGCLDLPEVFAAIERTHPDAVFRLAGCAGLFQHEAQIRRFFSSQVNSKMEVLMRFAADQLVTLLNDCKLAVFPSYWEGFGISVVECLAAGIPVAAYKVPGPSDILPVDWMVDSGNNRALARLACELFSVQDKNIAVRANSFAKRYRLVDLGKNLLASYSRALELSNRERTNSNVGAS